MSYLINDYEIFKRNANQRLNPAYFNPHTLDACGNEQLTLLDCKYNDYDEDVSNKFIRLYNCILKRQKINEAFAKEIMENAHMYTNEVLNIARTEYAKHEHMANALFSSYYKHCERSIQDRKLNPYAYSRFSIIQAGGTDYEYKYLKYKSKYLDLKKKLKQ